MTQDLTHGRFFIFVPRPCRTDVFEESTVPPNTDYHNGLEKFSSMFRTVRCVCRHVIAKKGISCCTMKPGAPAQTRKQGSPTARASSWKYDQTACSSRTSIKTQACCAQNLLPVPSSGHCSSVFNNNTPCCGSTLGEAIQAHEKPALSKKSAELTVSPVTKNPGTRNDVENDEGYEHVSLSVQGMTCNDCAEKLSRTLNAIPGTRNVRVNFIRGQADFSMESSSLTVHSVLSQSRAATGFVINRLAERANETLHLLMSEHDARALSQLNIDGLTDVTILNRKNVQVEYDPTLIGARDLLDRIGTLSTGLAPPSADPVISGEQRKFYRLLCYTISCTVLTLPVLVLSWGESLVSERKRGVLSFVLGTLVQLLAIPVFYKPALRALILYHSLELDMLVVVSISAAYMYSIVAFSFRLIGKPLETAELFETSTLLITLVMLGRLLSSYARIRAVAAVSLRSLQSTTAILVDTSNVEREIDSRLLQYGDRFKVLPHCRIPTDGTVIHGVSDVDESMITGESIPVFKQGGSNVVAGTVNGAGTLLIALEELPGKNTVVDIARLVEDASNSKPRVQDLADRVASYFLPVISATAMLVFIIWIIVGIRGRKDSAGEAVPVAVTYAIAVLAVSCPCALGLAVPMVLVIAGGISARGGVIIKSAEVIERSRKVTDVVFDKTGTLTEPELNVLGENYFDGTREDTVSVVRALVSESKHPVSVAVAKFLGESSQASSIVDLTSIPGSGVEARIDDVVFRAGNPQWTGNEGNARVQECLADGLTILLITQNSKPIALYGLRTKIRPDAAEVVSNLKSRGITIHLVSGDQPEAVVASALTVGIEPANSVARSTPEQKQAYVAALMEKGKYVLFCGDGTNDAVAVAQANIGAQISDSIISSDLTRESSDIVLLSGLKGIPFVIDLSKTAFRRILFNFVWAATYNVIAILLAGGAFVKVRIAPAYAGAGELVSVLPVIAAALSMLAVKITS